MHSLYRRPLPEGSIAFGSEQGRRLFGEALAAGTMENYFPLAEQHHTQADPAFCGLGSLVTSLNALAIDPGRLWKGPWRWFSEELLDCCVPLEVVRTSGLTLDEVACLARCNGATATLTRASESSEQQLREALRRSSQASGGPFVIAAYSRAGLGQSGGGHFSPLAGYHAASDLTLVLDVARFKYPPHWVPVERLFDAMLASDPITRKSRGFIELLRAQAPLSLVFAFAAQARGGEGWRGIARLVEHELRRVLLEQLPSSVDRAVEAVLASAREVASGIGLRPNIEASHRQAVERVLDQLRSSAAHDLATRAPGMPHPELTATLLYLVPPGVWDAAPAPVSLELRALLDPERLPPELRAELSVLRQQLAELLACRDDPGA